MKETLPSYEAMMPAVLKVLADGVARSLREVFERVCQHYAFTPEQLAGHLAQWSPNHAAQQPGWLGQDLSGQGWDSSSNPSGAFALSPNRVRRR